MRVLIVTWGWRSHFFSLVPLAWALRAAGHEVLVAGQPSMAADIVAAGLPAVGLGADLDFAEVFGGQVGRVGTAAERAAGLGSAGYGDGDGDGLDGYAVEPAITADGGVVRYAGAMLDDLVAFGRELRPHLVVHEPFNLAASLAAAALGVPAVRNLWGPDAGTELAMDENAVIGPLARRLGVGRVDLAGALTLDPCPAAIQVPLGGPSHPVRYVPYNGAAVLPDWLRALWTGRERRLVSQHQTPLTVCVTWGTMMAGLRLPDRYGLRRVVEAVAATGAEVLLAVRRWPGDRLDGLPAGVRLIDPPLPLSMVLPACGAVVHQGGAGTMMTALAHGLPQLVLPQVSDHHFNAERLVASGAGTSLTVARATADAIGAVVGKLLHGRRWRAAAAELRRQNEQRPAPAEVVPVLERLATTGAAA